MKSFSVIFSLIGAVLCFLPVIFQLEFNIDDYDNVNDVPIRQALESEIFETALISGTAVSFPVLLELMADMFSTYRGSNMVIFSKWAMVLALIIPNVIILSYVSPHLYFTAIPCIQNSRQIIIQLSFFTYMSNYGGKIWNSKFTSTATFLFSIAGVINSFEAFTWHKYMAVTYTRLAILLIISIWIVLTSLTWVRYLYMNFKKNIPLSHDEYCCNVHMAMLLFTLLGRWICVMTFGNEDWTSTNDVYLSAITYLQIFYTVSLTVWHGRIARREIAIAQSRRELETKRMFVRYVSHEIRTPLNTVTMGLHLLHNELSAIRVDSELIGIVNDLTVSCEIAVEILNDLLTYEKLSSNILKLDKSTISIVTFVQLTIHPFELQAREKNVNLKIIFGDGINININTNDNNNDNRGCLSIYADKSKLSQVIRNLVSNALKFTSMDSDVVITVSRIKRDGGGVIAGTGGKTGLGEMSSKMVTAAAAMTMSRTGSHSRLIRVHPRLSVTSSSVAPTAGTATLAAATMNRPPPPPPPIPSPLPLPSNNTNTSTSGGKALDYLRIDVKDTGAGISKENQGHLFKEIVQFNPGELQDGKGSGLGLWISSRIMALHDGELSVFSEGLGHGCTFTLTMPMPMPLPPVVVVKKTVVHSNRTQGYRDSRQQQQQVYFNLNRSTRSINAVQNISTRLNIINDYDDDVNTREDVRTTRILQDMRILIVDDAAMNRKMLHRILRNKCSFLCEASDGMEAVAKIKINLEEDDESVSIDIVLMDNQMPKMNGPDAAKEMRKLGFKGFIIGITGNALPADIDHFIRNGANKVLIKPLNVDELEASLEELSSGDVDL